MVEVRVIRDFLVMILNFLGLLINLKSLGDDSALAYSVLGGAGQRDFAFAPKPQCEPPPQTSN